MSSKGYIMVDEKKKKRMISNRESAKRSRMKKEQHMKDLNDQIFYFTRKRDEMLIKIEKAAKGYAAMENENMVLRSQKQELEKRLEYANNVCGWYEEIRSNIYVEEGIEFQAIDKVKHEEIAKLKEVQQAVSYSYLNADHVQQMPMNHDDDEEKVSSLTSKINGKDHLIVSAKAAVYDSSNMGLFTLKPSFESSDEVENDCGPVKLKFISYEGTMSGLIVEGLEFRP
nr:bZIP transcription factor 53-like [Tanacetum cinerariifolium]